MKYKFSPVNDTNLIGSPVSHDIIGEVDLDNIDMFRVISEGQTGTVAFRAENKEEQDKLDIFMEEFLKQCKRMSDKDDE